MKALTSSLLLVDQRDFPVSTTLTCFHATLSAAFRQTRRGRKHNASFPPSSSSFSSPASPIRKPPDRNGNGFLSYSPSTSKSSSPPLSLSSSREMELFLELIPSRLRTELLQHDAIADLIEVVLDLGRKPIARFPSGDWVLSEEPVKLEDLNHAISKVGEFSDDNRSGINHSLHRISAMRNRKLQIIGLTCRVGRAISGTAEMVHDLIAEGGSILVIGRPGVGKTTLIRS